LIWLVKWAGTLRTEADWDLLWQSAEAATACVAFSIALGVLACIDHFLFDADTAGK
jgi:ABC-type spermidine/putrescine transport system permease subunit II